MTAPATDAWVPAFESGRVGGRSGETAEVDALCCPRCGGRMRILAAITEAGVARRILACLALPTRAPPIALARPWAEPGAEAPPHTDSPQSEAFDFDQSLAEDWGFGA